MWVIPAERMKMRRPHIGVTEINVRQGILAADDLISFCIHARRLAENMGSKDLLNKTATRKVLLKP
jgi:hypothetical protein